MLNFYEPREQARFRSGFLLNGHLQVTKTLIERCMEYNKPLVLVFIDYEKSFDQIDQDKVFEALAECRIDATFRECFKDYVGLFGRKLFPNL